MLHIALTSPGQFTAGDGPEPVAGAGEAIVRVERVGVCGSDIHAYHGRHPFIRYPVILGHELAGVVLSAPSNDRGIAAGDRVSIEPFRPCGRCHACRIGRPNCCEFMHLIGIHGDGGMRPRLAVPLKDLHKSAALSLDQLATIEPLSIGQHAVERGKIAAGQTVLVVGAGPIGLAAMQFAVLAGGRVTVAEISDVRRKWVADRFNVETIAAVDDRRYEVVIDATGNPRAMEGSFHSVEYGGRLVFVGVIKSNISFDDALLHAREITLLASRNSCGAFPGIIRQIEQKQFDPSAWITHRMELADVPRQFGEVIASPGMVKSMIDIKES